MHTTQQNGFTLIEVLVSVFVLALGVIGIAGMQLTAMRNSQQSNYQTVAVQLASELADNMRSNAAVMKKDDSDNPFLFSYDSASGSNPDEPGSKCYTTTNCDADALAKFDIYEWSLRLKGMLPNGRVKVCRDKQPVTGGTLTWDCTAPLSGGVNSPMVIKVGWQVKGASKEDKSYLDSSGKLIPAVAITVESYSNPKQ